MKFVSQGMVEDPIAFLRDRKIISPIPTAYPKLFVEFDELVVICFWPETDAKRNERRVFAFDRSGKVVWQIQSLRKDSSQLDLDDYDPINLVGFSKKEGVLIVSTFGEDYAIVDVRDGSVTVAGSRFSPRSGG